MKQQLFNLFEKSKTYWKRPVSKAIIIITTFGLLSRVLGFLRQAVVVNTMDKVSSDLLLAANKIPENIAQLLITGTIISSVLPIASRLESRFKNNTKEVSKYLNLVILSLLVVIGFINLLVLIFTPQILGLTFITSQEVQNFFNQANLWNDYILVTRILLIGPLIFALQAVLNVFLFLKKRYLTYSLAGIIYNLGAISGVLISGRNGYIATAWGMILGASITTLVYLIDSRKFGYHGFVGLFVGIKSKWQNLITNWQELRFEIFNTWKSMLPRIFILDAVITANLLITPIAQSQGQITAVDIAFGIQGAFFIIVTSLGTVVFPDLAKLYNEHGKLEQFWQKLIFYTKRAVGLSVLVTFITILFAPVIMWVFSLLGKGQGNGSYIVYIAQIASIGLFLRGGREIMGKYFFVRERYFIPAILSILAILVQVLVVFILYKNNIDSGLNVAISITINNLVWFILAIILIFKDWKGRGVKPVKNEITISSPNQITSLI